MVTLLVDRELHTLIAEADRVGLALPLVEGRLALGEIGLVGRGVQALVIGAGLYIVVSGYSPRQNERAAIATLERVDILFNGSHSVKVCAEARGAMAAKAAVAYLKNMVCTAGRVDQCESRLRTRGRVDTQKRRQSKDIYLDRKRPDRRLAKGTREATL